MKQTLPPFSAVSPCTTAVLRTDVHKDRIAPDTADLLPSDDHLFLRKQRPEPARRYNTQRTDTAVSPIKQQIRNTSDAFRVTQADDFLCAQLGK